MDWPSFALLTYGFILAALLAAMILRGLRSAKGRYQRILEEKEQNLAAMQLEMEETMETLARQAAALEVALEEASQREHTASLAWQQRLLELQGGVVAVQSRLLQLEQRVDTLDDMDMAPDSSAEDGLPAPEVPAPEAAFAPAPGAPPDGEQQADSSNRRQKAYALFASGEDAASVSRALGCSCVEAAMLRSQWEKGYL